MPNNNQPAEAMVPLRLLTDLARMGAAMRRAQKAYFKKRKEQPGMSADGEYRAARNAEATFDAACYDALNRERTPLPGMAEEGGEF